jgi:hypothetical protein
MHSKFLFFIILFSKLTLYCQIKGETHIPILIKKNRYIERDSIYVKYEIDTLNKMFNGKLKLIDKDGMLILSGNYKSNQKKDKWDYFDSKGNLLSSRNYKNSYQFDELKSNKKKILKYQFERNKESNLIIYPFVADSCVEQSTRYYSYIPKNLYNKYIFSNDMLYNKIIEYVNLKDNPEIYSTSDFLNKLSKNKIQESLNLNKSKIIGYKICEYFYFDSCISNSESRILGICPVIWQSEKKNIDLFWIYYPNFRTQLANELININKEVKSLEDLFHFRYFNSQIYFQLSVSNEEGQIDLFSFSDNKLLQNSINKEIHKLMTEYRMIKLSEVN